MRPGDLLRISLRQVIRQRRRNLAVVLAIALGTAGFIVIITMGRDVKINFNRDLDLLGGATRLRVYFQGMVENPMIQKPEWFRDETVAAIKALPGVMGVAPVVGNINYAPSFSIQRDRLYRFLVIGVDETYWDVNSFSPKHGRFFLPEEVQQAQKVCVIGDELAMTIFGRQEVTGEMLQIDKDMYTVVGVLGGVSVADRGRMAFVPLATAQARLPLPDVLRILYIRCFTWDDVEGVVSTLPGVVRAHQSARYLAMDVSWERLKAIKRISFLIELFIFVAIVATLSLGGFGIWNIMMMGVKARTREIGLKKAMGAEDRDIMAQFMAEALWLSVGAAVLGIALGRVAMEIISYALGRRPPEDVFLLCVVLGLIFSMIIGVAAGLSPSIKASRMEVVSAVRYE